VQGGHPRVHRLHLPGHRKCRSGCFSFSYAVHYLSTTDGQGLDFFRIGCL
jgi:hypothetical protein